MNDKLKADMAASAKVVAAKEAQFKTRFAEKNSELAQLQRELDQVRRESSRSKESAESRLKSQLHNVTLR